MPITFWSPRAQPEVVYFLISNESPYFSDCKSKKFQLQILCSFGDTTKSVKLMGIPENNFLCIFIIASSPGVHSFFCLWRVNKKLPQGWNVTKCISEVKVNQLKVKNMHVRIGTSTFNSEISVQSSVSHFTICPKLPRCTLPVTCNVFHVGFINLRCFMLILYHGHVHLFCNPWAFLVMSGWVMCSLTDMSSNWTK